MADSEKLQQLNASSTTALSARVPIDLHPDSILNHGAVLVDAEGSGPTIDAYGAARHALRAMHDSVAHIDAAHSSLLRPEPIVGAVYAQGSKPILKNAIPKERAGELASAMAASASRASSAVQRNLDVVDKTIDKLNGFIDRKTTHPKPNDASVVAEAAAIREHVKNLPIEKRLSFLTDACDENDLPVVAAVLNASPFTSGLDRKQHALLRTFANDAFALTETKQRAALVSIKQTLERATTVYAREYAKRLPKVADDPSATPLATLRGKGEAA